MIARAKIGNNFETTKELFIIFISWTGFYIINSKKQETNT